MKDQQPLLFFPGSASKPYEAIRDDPEVAPTKAFLENLWTQFRSYADCDFLPAIRKEGDFYQRLWELHLGGTLLRKGYDLAKVGKKGPDFLVTLDHKKAWIEAITPKAGTTKDAVPLLRWNSVEAQEIPETQILLRFTNAIDEKWKKYKKYSEEGIISPDDCYIIAISWSDRCYSRTPLRTNSVPYIIRAVLPYGTEIASFNKGSDDSSEIFSLYREQIEKTEGSPISTNIFLREEYSGISAIIYSEENLTNFPDINIPENLGKSFLYLHNPLAKNKLPIGAFKFCKEYWYSLGERKLKSKDWSKA